MAITNKISEVKSEQTEVDTILENFTCIDNITDLAGTKEFLKKLFKVVSYLESGAKLCQTQQK